MTLAPGELHERIARHEERLNSQRESLNRHDAWIRGHDEWAGEQRDALYRAITEAERRVMARLESNATEFRNMLGELRTRVFAWQIAGSIIAAAIAAIASAVGVYAALVK